MKSLRWVVSYFLVAIFGLWMAFAVSSKLMSPARSQEGPSTGELPPEFAKEAGATDPAPSSTATPDPSASAQGSSAPTSAQSAPENNPGGSPENAANAEQPRSATVNPPVLSQSLITGDDYVYDPVGKRDPFKPIGIKALGLARPVVLEPLQRFELEKLQVVGILWDVRSPRAMVKDPDGIMHTVIKNSKIGRSEGFVATIREGEIVVVETLYEDGKTLKQTRVMELKK